MTNAPLFLISVPGLRPSDIDRMPKLKAITHAGEMVPLSASFPAVTWPVQANMLTGCLPNQHGVVANGFYWRDKQQVEMWTAWNDKIEQPQIWDRLHQGSVSKRSAVWFPMLSKGCGADNICMPAPIHNPDGSESLWCYTKPTEYYGELRDQFGHFPLKHFWGPLAGRPSSQWIIDSAAYAAKQLRPDFFYIYVPHLDYAAQKVGPDSPQALAAVAELDEMIDKFYRDLTEQLDMMPRILVVSEYVITAVSHVLYPNRLLRQAGLLKVKQEKGGEGEEIDFENSQAWALVDHQFSHVFVKNGDAKTISQVEQTFSKQPGVADVLSGDRRAALNMKHARSGECIVISSAESWQAYYWWLDDARAPSYARTVDIHRKPGYDPVELHFDMANKCIPLDASLIRGSHGAPVLDSTQVGVAISNMSGIIGTSPLRDIDIFQKTMAAVQK